MDAFANGTKALAAAVATSKAFTLAGGGDTVSAINVFKIEDKVGYISTAGGAFLEFLEVSAPRCRHPRIPFHGLINDASLNYVKATERLPLLFFGRNNDNGNKLVRFV